MDTVLLKDTKTCFDLIWRKRVYEFIREECGWAQYDVMNLFYMLAQSNDYMVLQVKRHHKEPSVVSIEIHSGADGEIITTLKKANASAESAEKT